MTKAVNEEKMITLETVDGERVDFYVLEETRISGMNYLLVTDAPEDAQEGECYILKDKSKAEEEEAVYEFVEDDGELEYLYKIFTELTEDMDVKDICAHFQIGKTRLYEIARESYGMGIAEFIRRQRIEMAQELLRDFPELSISDVASRCGFQDYNYFFTVCRNIVGKSPKEYSNEE